MAQQPPASTTLHLVAGASPTDPMAMPMAAGMASAEGQGGMRMDMRPGMAAASGIVGSYGSRGPGSAQASGTAGETPRGSVGMNSTRASGTSPGGSPAGAQALPDVPTDIPSPVIQKDPTFTLPVVIQSSNSVPQATTSNEGAGIPLAQAGSSQAQPQAQAQAQAAGNSISQAEASGTNNVANSSANSWSSLRFNKERALLGVVISVSLLCFL